MQLLTKKVIPFELVVPKGYVDIHSHILPGIDDGAKTIYQSAFIVESFKNMGIKKMIATPHVIQDVWKNTTEIINSKLVEVRETLDGLDIKGIKVHASAEYMMDDMFYKRLKKKDILPLYDKFILVEMSTYGPPINLKEIVFEIRLAGFIPILAHPERYTFYNNEISKFEELKTLGFMFQLNLLSLSGYYGDTIKSFALKLLRLGYYDFSGSDVHNYYQLNELEKGFDEKISIDLEDLLQQNKIFS